MKKRNQVILWLATLLLSFLLGIIFITYIYYKEYHFAERTVRSKFYKNYNSAPYNRNIKFESSILPIITIECGEIKKEESIPAKMKVFPNGGAVNQVLDNGEGGASYDIIIKYRGQSSYIYPKKSFSIRTLDAPLDDGGVKSSVSLLGMKPGSKWALLAEWCDRSYVRQALSYELAYPLMDYVPKTKYCEVFINKIYYGLYQLSEQPTRKRLGISKGGCILYLVHKWQRDFSCIYEHAGETVESDFEMKYPKYENCDSSSIDVIKTSLYDMIYSFDDSQKHSYEKIIDVKSFADYQISSEFSKNIDAYNFSAYLYKEGEDSPYKMSLWDVDISFGGDVSQISLPNGWVYDGGGNGLWWQTLMKDKRYRDAVAHRWTQCRKNEYSDERIAMVLDSLVTCIKSSGAAERDALTWGTYSTVKEYNPHMWWEAISFEEEVRFLRNWIDQRLMWMDSQLK